MNFSNNRDGAYDSNLITSTNAKMTSYEPVPFQLGEAMVAQKTLKKQTQEITKIKEVLAELQIYVQKHQVMIGQEMVDDIKLKVTVESLRNEMEIRYDLALRQFYE